jgi:hypothetical protein
MDHRPPRKTATIYDLPGIINMSLKFASTPANISVGFLATGIIPYSTDVFLDEFPSSYVIEEL